MFFQLSDGQILAVGNHRLRVIHTPGHTPEHISHAAGSVCGRGLDGKPVSTIGRERRENPALQRTEEEFMQFQLENLPPVPIDFHTIKSTNLGYHV